MEHVLMRGDMNEGFVGARLVVGQAHDAAGAALHDLSIARIPLRFQGTNFCPLWRNLGQAWSTEISPRPALSVEDLIFRRGRRAFGG